MKSETETQNPEVSIVKPAHEKLYNEACEKYGKDKVKVFGADGLECILRKPTRQEIHAFQNMLMKDVSRAQDNLFRTLWIVGDADLKDSDDYYLASRSAASELLNTKQLDLKN